ncbi:MAG: hypothetical protein K2X81_13225, partial [Candidatus Obscuribacterales bacterium]|nr:hypothetical protein [Candidatus Obscuribacterales bacterium]
RLYTYKANSAAVQQNDALLESLVEHTLAAEAMQIVSHRDFLALLDYPNKEINSELTKMKARLLELLEQLHNISINATSEPVAAANCYELIPAILQLPGRPDATSDVDFDQFLSKLKAIEPAYNYVHLALSRMLLALASNYLPAGRTAMVMEVALWCLPIERSRNHYQDFAISGVCKATELIATVAMQEENFELAHKYIDQLIEYCKTSNDQHWIYQADSLKSKCNLAYLACLSNNHPKLNDAFLAT